MSRRRATKPETRLRKAQVELHNVKNVVRWAIRALRYKPALRGYTDAEIANELTRIIGDPEVEVPENERGPGPLRAKIVTDEDVFDGDEPDVNREVVRITGESVVTLAPLSDHDDEPYGAGV